MKMQSRYAVAACLIAMVLLLMGTQGQAMTFTASDISHTAAITQDETTFLAATSSDSLYVAGVAQFTGATASGTALVIGGSVPLFASADNTLTIQGTLALKNGETIGNSTNNVVFINSISTVVATDTA